MRTAAIIIVLLLASCTHIDTASQQAPTAPIPRDEPLNPPEPVIIERINDSQLPRALENDSGLKDAIANDSGHDEWKEWYGVSAATLLVTDGRTAARLYLPQGKTVLLPLEPEVLLSVKAIGSDGRAFITVNDESEIMSEREDAPFLNGSIRVFVREVIVVE